METMNGWFAMSRSSYLVSNMVVLHADNLGFKSHNLAVPVCVFLVTYLANYSALHLLLREEGMWPWACRGYMHEGFFFL